MANPQIVVEYIAKTEGLKRGADDASTATGKVARGARKAFLPAVAVLGALGVAAGKAIKDASNLGEQVNKTGVVFGKAAPQIHEWAKTTAESIGISERAALEAAGTFGNMLVPMGFARKDAARMSQRMVTLAADMASFNNASPEDTLEALRSGLAGETEPLRKFGVFLNDARLKQQAMAMGLYSGKGALDSSAKAQATYALILKDSTDAQGDFANTSDSVANQQRIQAARTEDLSASMGKALLPATQAVQEIMLDVLGVLGKNTGVLKVLIIIVAGLAAAIVAMNVALTVYRTVQLAATAAAWLFNSALFANPIGLVVLALVALGAALIVAYRHSETFRRIVDASFDAVVGAAKAAFGWIKANWPLLLGILTGPFGLAIVLIIRNFDKIEEGARAAVAVVKNAFNGLVDWMAGLVDRIGAVAGRIAGAIKAPINAVIRAWNSLAFTIPAVKIPTFTVGGKKFGGGGFGGATISFPNIPLLAQGGVVLGPTLAMVGEAGPELIVPLGSGAAPIEVRVYIGDQELRGLVRSEVRTEDTRTAQTLLAGLGG